MSEVLLKAERISKKFCRDLKRSMLYGIQDIFQTIIGISPNTDKLKRDEFWALDDISFDLKRGECLGLIGRNGSGKSTILKLLNGIILPDKGRIKINGRVGALIEVGAGFHPLLTGRENIYINGTILGLTKKELNDKFDEIVEFSELSEFIDMPVKNYSSGMRVRLGFSIAAQLRPDILLIDEVLAVGDLGFRYKCFNKISEIMDQAAIIFVSHDMAQISRICTRLILMEKGKILFHDDNIIKGVQKYISQFSVSKGFIAGNGKAQIHVCRIGNGRLGDDDQEVAQLEYGDDLIVDILMSLDESVKNAQIVLNILDQKQTAVMQSISVNSGFIISNNGRAIKLKVKLPKIHLNPALYQIWIVVTDEKRREVYLTHYGIKSFRVTGSFIGFCSVQIMGEWECEDIELHQTFNKHLF